MPSSSPSTSENEERHVPAIIGSLPGLPKTAAITALADKLAARGMALPAAGAIARAAADPRDFRKALDNPVPLRVFGGTLELVYVRLWAAGVLPMPNNMRLSEELTYPIAGDEGTPPLPEPEAAPNSFPHRVLTVPSADVVTAALDHEVGYLLNENRYVESIAAEGVREPILASALTVEHADGTDSVTVMVADDGSSRLSSCYDILALNPADVAYRLSLDPRAFRGGIKNVLSLGDQDVATLTSRELAMLAALTVPAAVVVGFRPDNDGDGMDIARAIAHRVGNIHVDPPKHWGDGSRLDSQLSATLRECARKGKVRAAKAQYFAGMLDRDAASRAGLSPWLDHRAADLLGFFEPQTNARPINDGLRGLLGAKSVNPTKGTRLDIAVEAAIRAYRAGTAERHVGTARRALRSVFGMPEFTKRAGWVPDLTTHPEDLRDAALEELEGDGPGLATHQLALLAAFWLVRWGCINPTRGGYHTDRREIPAVLRDIWETERGVHQLYQAIVDGRHTRPVTFVRVNGSCALKPSGEPVLLNDELVRSTWEPGDRPVPPSPSQQTPEGALNERRLALRQAVDATVAALNALSEPKSSAGQPLVVDKGLSGAYVDGLIEDLNKVTEELAGYRFVWRRNGTVEPTEAEYVEFAGDDAAADAAQAVE